MRPKVGPARPAMTDVARAAGVSHQTVSRVINDDPHVRPDTRRRVLEAIASLGYRPNNAARALVTHQSRTIGLIASGSTLNGPTQTMAAIESGARTAGMFLTVAMFRDQEYTRELLDETVDQFLRQGVDALVVIAPQAEMAQAARALRSPVPVILVTSLDTDSGAAGPARSRASSAAPEATVEAGSAGAGLGRLATIWIDQADGVRQVTEHLAGLGHRRVAHISGPGSWTDARVRCAAWEREASRRGWGSLTVPSPDWSAASGYRIGTALLSSTPDERPTAVFAGNDLIALGVLRAGWDLGMRIPGDISVVGFDDFPGTDSAVPPLTTVAQPFEELGRLCMATVLRLTGATTASAAARDASARVRPVLLVRASTGRPPA